MEQRIPKPICQGQKHNKEECNHGILWEVAWTRRVEAQTAQKHSWKPQKESTSYTWNQIHWE